MSGFVFFLCRAGAGCKEGLPQNNLKMPQAQNGMIAEGE